MNFRGRPKKKKKKDKKNGSLVAGKTVYSYVPIYSKLKSGDLLLIAPCSQKKGI